MLFECDKNDQGNVNSQDFPWIILHYFVIFCHFIHLLYYFIVLGLDFKQHSTGGASTARPRRLRGESRVNQRTIHDFYSVDCVPKYIILSFQKMFSSSMFYFLFYIIYISHNIMDTHCMYIQYTYIHIQCHMYLYICIHLSIYLSIYLYTSIYLHTHIYYIP